MRIAAANIDDQVVVLNDSFDEFGDHSQRYNLRTYDKDGTSIPLFHDQEFRSAYRKFLHITHDAKRIVRFDRIIQTKNDLIDLLNHTQFKNSVLDFKWKFHMKNAGVAETEDENAPLVPCWAIYASFERPDTLTGETGIGLGREEIIKPGFTETRAFFVAYTIFEMLIRHEFMEGVHLTDDMGHFRVTNPHSSVWSLAMIQPDEIGVQRIPFLSNQVSSDLCDELGLDRIVKGSR